MEEDHHKHIKTVLMIVICVLFLILGTVIGLLIAGSLSDRPLEPWNKPESGDWDRINEGSSEETDRFLKNPSESRESTVKMSENFESIAKMSEDFESTAKMDEASDETVKREEQYQLSEDSIRIVLDPGHDDICARNHPDLGVNEQDLNLKIALACRDELNTYEGVEVFMTREDGSCPDNGIGSDDVTGRTAYAQSVDANLFVSIHNNATGLGYPSEANGCEIYISVHSAFSDESRKLGESILAELTTQLDLADRGVLTRIKPEKGYYEDGNVKDWYYLISTSVERGFPGIIIEHAFMDNPHDLELLKNDEKLKAMGVADAAGIAQYYGLEKKEE